LYIVVDDLRVELPIYGQQNIVAPHLQALAARGTVFDRAYCNQPVCSPSRNSFMTSRRPDKTKAWNFKNDFREVGPRWTTLVRTMHPVLGWLRHISILVRSSGCSGPSTEARCLSLSCLTPTSRLTSLRTTTSRSELESCFMKISLQMAMESSHGLTQLFSSLASTPALVVTARTATQRWHPARHPDQRTLRTHGGALSHRQTARPMATATLQI
jgi:hypothetical protein